MGFFSKLFSSNDSSNQSSESNLTFSSLDDALGIDFSDMSKYPVKFKKKVKAADGGIELEYTLKLDNPVLDLFDKVEITEFCHETCFVKFVAPRQAITQGVIDFTNYCTQLYGKDRIGRGSFKSSDEKNLSLFRRSWDKVDIDYYDKPYIQLNSIEVHNLPSPDGIEARLPLTESSLEEMWGEPTDKIWLEGVDVKGTIYSFDEPKKIVIKGEEFDWHNIIGFNYEKNLVQGNTIIESKVNTGNMIGRALVGALVAGPAGGVVGAVTATRSQTISHQDNSSKIQYTLHIYTDIPTRSDITIIRPICEAGLKEDAELYTINEIQELISRIIESNSESASE